MIDWQNPAGAWLYEDDVRRELEARREGLPAEEYLYLNLDDFTLGQIIGVLQTSKCSHLILQLVLAQRERQYIKAGRWKKPSALDG